jgi:hypothetical protein
MKNLNWKNNKMQVLGVGVGVVAGREINTSEEIQIISSETCQA